MSRQKCKTVEIQSAIKSSIKIALLLRCFDCGKPTSKVSCSTNIRSRFFTTTSSYLVKVNNISTLEYKLTIQRETFGKTSVGFAKAVKKKIRTKR